jgi:hypothetical protein
VRWFARALSFVLAPGALLLWPAEGLAQCASDADCAPGSTCRQGACQPSSSAAGAVPVVSGSPTSTDEAAQPASGVAQDVDAPWSPPVYQHTSLPMAVWITGGAVFVASWGGLIALTAASVDEGEEAPIAHAAVPLVGPWLMIKEDDTRDYDTFVILSGVLQAAGIGALVLGLTLERSQPVEESAAPADGSEAAVSVTAAPWGSRGAAVVAVGVF